MMKLAAALRAVLFLFLAFLLSGCFPLTRSGLEDEKDPHYLEGSSRLGSRDYEGAMQSFQRALQTNPNNAAAHLQLGVLYDEWKNDNASAIYHFQKHLEARPDSSMAEVVKEKIVGCTRELAQKVALVVAPADIQKEMARLAEASEQYQLEITRLRQQLAEKPRVITNTVYVTREVPVPTPMPEDDPEEPAPEPDPVRVAETPLPRPFQSRPDPTPQRDPDPEPAPAVNSSGGWVPTHITPPAGRRPTPVAARPSRIAHRLKKGETIAGLARQYGVSIRAITAANPGMNPNRVLAGETVYIPR